ncbi:MAG: prepilin-type cleavage/methylation domain-containing protein, partial [Phycisphaeraceae bacterium]
MRHHQLILRGHLAFTLAELLIALLIVMILIALLLPVLRHARRTVKEIACGNNLHQAGLALFNYAVDHDDYLPYGDRRIPPNHQRIAYAHNSL